MSMLLTGAPGDEWVDGESLEWSEGLPVLTYLRIGDPRRPLVVFLSGGGHLARVSYGHRGARPDSFLAHWLAAGGFTVLALSYPSDHPVFPAAHPELTVDRWAEAAAVLTQRIVAEHRLQAGVILCGWSMAGRSVHPFAQTAQRIDLDLRCFISLAASAPIPGLVPVRPAGEPLTPDGLWEPAPRHPPKRLDDWYGQITAQAEPHRPIMSRDEYVRHYLCRHSVGLRGEAQHWDGRASIHDIEAAIRETGTGRWAEFPVCAAIVPQSAQDARHALSDHLTWPAITAWRLQWQLSEATTLPDDTWAHLQAHSRQLSTELVRSMPGNHFFFLGTTGARRTARHIEELWQATENLNDLEAGAC
ncbi:hypothetical protein [Streptomyces rugosispiralis]|uniref:Thioesterase n=1 Tax=Streptomyces rugosispiralis TaxID=2967341 RepID=A0ABT1V986_9ACTN|nr:hypothetical protein [Streptomyces rugosispiralis]MCQ8193851.1 hypothetical protein [Streptomyces rugosispiralis]